MNMSSWSYVNVTSMAFSAKIVLLEHNLTLALP